MILVNEQEKVFHLNNGRISYLLYIMESGQLGHLYFGQALNPNGSYLHMVEKAHRPMTTYINEGDLYTSYNICARNIQATEPLTTAILHWKSKAATAAVSAN